MCHNDHRTRRSRPHRDPRQQRSHGRDSQASRAATSRTSADKDRTDFQPGPANGGMCLSCHRNPVDAAHPAIDKAGYTASAHNYTTFGTYGAWQYTQHDGSSFQRNCTKCHSDRNDTRPGASVTPFGAVHFSDYPSLLAGSTNPAGTPATFVCYNCHGNGTTGTDYSGKPIATQVAKTRNHPSNADSVHNSVTELANAAFGNTLGVTGRHSSCLDCHETHEARSGTHATPGNLAGPPLEGAWGAQLSSNPAFWTARRATSRRD
jgi:nitrate reductase cytochrome c-type subunit